MVRDFRIQAVGMAVAIALVGCGDDGEREPGQRAATDAGDGDVGDGDGDVGDGDGDTGDGDTGDGDGDHTGPAGSVGKASPFDFGDGTSGVIADAIQGEHDVVIYSAQNTADLGLAKLSVAHEADGTFRMSLTSKSGSTFVRSAPLADSECGDGICLNLWREGFPDVLHALDGKSRDVSIYNYYESGSKSDALYYFQASFYADGSVKGLANGLAFRNAVLAYGTQVPAIFGTLAGSYVASVPGLCSENEGSFILAADGALRLTGKSNVSCEDQDVTSRWDGNDDLLISTATGARLLVDSYNQGGSLPGGGLTLELSAPGDAAQLTNVTAKFGGGAGNIVLDKPARK